MATKFLKLKMAEISESNQPRPFHTFKYMRRLYGMNCLTAYSITKPFKYLSSNLYIQKENEPFRFINVPFRFKELFYIDRENNFNRIGSSYNSKPILLINKVSLNMALKNICFVDREDEENYEDEEEDDEFFHFY